MLKTPTCENCKHFKYKGLTCKEHQQGIPDEIMFVSKEELAKICPYFEEIEW